MHHVPNCPIKIFASMKSRSIALLCKQTRDAIPAISSIDSTNLNYSPGSACDRIEAWGESFWYCVLTELPRPHLRHLCRLLSCQQHCFVSDCRSLLIVNLLVNFSHTFGRSHTTWFWACDCPPWCRRHNDIVKCETLCDSAGHDSKNQRELQPFIRFWTCSTISERSCLIAGKHNSKKLIV